MYALQIKTLSKRYNKKIVLDNISLDVEEGEIFGLLGPSGAGKTTLIKIILGLIPKDQGRIFIRGVENSDFNTRLYTSFGTVLDVDGLYQRLSCYENLDIYARLYGIENRRKIIYELLERVGLYDARDKKTSTLSKGMRQRLAFARAVIHSPKIIFLDEPTSGIDPSTALNIHELMWSLASDGTTIFLTTHNMNEAQQLCNHLALLNNGKIIENGTPTEICLKYFNEKTVDIEYVNGSKKTVGIDCLIDILTNSESIARIHSNEPTLEDVFIKLTGRGL